jgi:ADP-heptose:LPS heptosyltransferase
MADAPAIAILMKQELLGDAITRIPALRALRCAFPDHRIVGLYRQDTAFDKALSRVRGEFYDETRSGVPAQDNVSNVRAMLRSVPNLTAVLDFQSSGRVLSSYLATAGMNVRYVANVAGFALRRGLSHAPEIRPVSNARRYHRAVELIAGRKLPFHPTLDLSAESRARAFRFADGLGRFVLMVPGPSRHRKFWSKDRWIALARHVEEQGIRPVFFVGPHEIAEREWIASALPRAAIVDAASAGGDDHLLWFTLALSDRAIGAVAYEGGIGHLIATRDTPILTIAGPTDPARWQPVTRYHWIARAPQSGPRETGAVTLADVIAQTDEMIRFSDRHLHRAGEPALTLAREAV